MLKNDPVTFNLNKMTMQNILTGLGAEQKL